MWRVAAVARKPHLLSSLCTVGKFHPFPSASRCCRYLAFCFIQYTSTSVTTVNDLFSGMDDEEK